MREPLRIEQARAALATLSRDQAGQLVEEAAVVRCNRRRPSRLLRRRMRQCPACRRFTSNPSRPCVSCGYLDGAGYAA